MVRAAFLRMKKIYSWQRGVKTLFNIRNPILRIGRLILAKYSIGVVRGIMVLIFRFEKLRKKQGLKGLCLYLKGCSILIIKFISQDPTPRNSVTYGCHISLTKRGIPRILPLYFRNEIVKGNGVIIKLVLTILGLYRVLPFDAPLKTNTITDRSEFEGVDPEFGWFIKTFVNLFCKIKIKESFNPFLLSSAGNSLEPPRYDGRVSDGGYDRVDSDL